MSKNAWTHSMPVYVTRKDADGTVGHLGMAIWMPVLALMLVWLNLIVWSIVGLAVAVQVVL